MPEETTQSAAQVFEEGLRVKRNGVEIPFTKDRVTGGEKKGTSFLAVTLDINPEQGVKWFGFKEAWDILRRQLRRFSKEWSFQAYDEESGTFDVEKFKSMVAELSARGETLASLKERAYMLSVELIELYKRSIGLEGDAKAAIQKEINAKMETIASVQDAMATKKKTPKEEKEAADLPDPVGV